MTFKTKFTRAIALGDHRLVRRLLPLVLLLPLALLLPLSGAGRPADASSMIYKNYIVRYDRGWDILCEPYVVQKNDWILKIFRQKGEIAHADFRDFLGIFQRLNPHVTDINLLRPGQAIDIPLRKLEHGTLSGQASGVVTIPFVTLAKVTEAVLQNAMPYTVQRGDTVSQLIAKYYGRFGSRAYQEGVKLFQAANPQIENLDKIYAGQNVYMPDPAIREKEWYAAMYDAEGNLRETIDMGAAGSAGAAGRPLPNSRLPGSEPEAPPSVLAQAAATVGGQLNEKGTYFIPQPAGQDFEVDLSQHPMLTLPEQKMLFTRDGRIMGIDPETLKPNWPEGKVVTYDEQAPVEEIVAAIFDAIGGAEEQTRSEVGFTAEGVQVTVHAKWVKELADQRWLCITPIAGPDEQTPESVRRYLAQNGIELKEMFPGGQAVAAAPTAAAQRHLVKNILAIAPTGQKDFTQRLCRALGFTYAPDVAVTFPYAGVQIQAYANLVSAPGGKEILVDFGNLYGDAVKAIGASGMQVVQISADDTFTAMIRKILDGLGLSYTENPTLPAARRSSEFNTFVTVQGVLYTDAQASRTLLSAANLHSAVTDLLSAEGIAMITW